MTAFYFRYTKNLAEYYARWMLANLAEAKHTPDSPQRCQRSVALTSAETMRVTRTIYRLQLLCHLTDPDNDSIMLPLSYQKKMVEAFLGILEPWEIEELYSCFQFATDVYGKVFEDIKWDLHPDNPKFDDQRRPPTPYGAFELDAPFRDWYLEGIILRGVPLLHTVLSGAIGREHLVSTMQQQIHGSYIPFDTYEGVLGSTTQEMRRRDNPSKQDLMQNTPMPFRGDGEPDAPPLAWTMIWGATYSSLYGCYLPNGMRRWGYVFWDAETLERTGGTKLLMRQREEYWGEGEDPREWAF